MDCWRNKHATHNTDCVGDIFMLQLDDIIKWKQFPRCWPLCGEFTGHRWIPRTKASVAELWCFLWSAHEYTVEQTIVRQVIWDAITLIMTPSQWIWSGSVLFQLLIITRGCISAMIWRCASFLANGSTAFKWKLCSHWIIAGTRDLGAPKSLGSTCWKWSSEVDIYSNSFRIDMP